MVPGRNNVDTQVSGMRGDQRMRERKEGDKRRASGERPVSGASVFRRRCEAESRGHFHQVRERVGFHLLHHLAAVRLHRDFADTEFPTYPLIQQPGNHLLHNLSFTLGKRCMTVPEHPHLSFLTEHGVAAFESNPNTTQ